MKDSRSCIIISASSDIGYALSRHLKKKGMQIFGTYRTHSLKVKDQINEDKSKLVECDLLSDLSISHAWEIDKSLNKSHSTSFDLSSFI